MHVAPQIIFHDVDRSPWVEEYIAERMAHLERFAQDIIRCHVTLTQEQGSQRKGNRDMQTELPAIINEAFGAIETQLKRTVARRRGDAKQHMTVGTEARFAAEQGEE